MEYMSKFIIGQDDTAFLIIDVQEKLASVMEARDAVLKNCLHLIELSKLLNLPLVVTEQYPKGLGRTLPRIRDALTAYNPIEKITFNCCDAPGFLKKIKKLHKGNIIVAGMETHICVLQTCIGLLESGFNVHIVKDAVCSRTEENRLTGIEYMRDAGAVITCAETAIFQLLKAAGTIEFKIMSGRLK